MPYWYVLTDRMIAASERLCEEAMRQESDFDPYRAGMTSAMTEEMFFTSFVEGAQIPLQEAMDFLQRGTEPESIQEQMIWNNRRAWAEMTGTIYRPLDDSFVKTLAYMLTEEMEGCAENYRQTDQHVIAAMNSEPYDVPTAYSLPNRMYEYYAYLQRPDEHPLIKAAVAQAFLLVTRPFPEGNERLSRMMSSAVLMRCGYDFFRDISISSVIARESYRYYKCMREIIRAENGGDLTYFLQYYLELLVRALDMRNERLRKREEEALEREREMAMKPLERVPPPPDENQHSKALGDEGTDELAPDMAEQSIGGETLKVVPLQLQSNSFDKRTEVESAAVEQDMDGSAEMDETDVAGQDAVLMNSVEEESPPGDEYFMSVLERMENSRSEHVRRTASVVRIILAKGKTGFTRKEWMKFSGMSEVRSRDSCDYLLSRRLIRNSSPLKTSAEYVFTHLQENDDHHPDAKRPSVDLIRQLREMANNETNKGSQRVCSILLDLVEKGVYAFSAQDVARAYNIGKSTSGGHLRCAVNLGFVHMEKSRTIHQSPLYVFNHDRVMGVRWNCLTKKQREMITMLYDVCKTREFSVRDAAAITSLSESSMVYHLHHFVQCGIMKARTELGKKDAYSLATTPKRHPSCFLQEDPTDEQGVSPSSVSVKYPYAAAGA